MAEDDDDGGGSAPPAHHAPPHGGGGIKAKLGRRVGPLPVWGWGMVATGGLVAFYLLLHRKGGAASGGPGGIGAVLPGDASGVGLGTSGGGTGGAGDPTGGGVIVTPPASDASWWNNATAAHPVTRSGVGTLDPAHPFDSQGSNPAAMDPQHVTDWLVGGSHYPGEVAASAPPGYHLRPDLVSGPAYDPYDPANYVPDTGGSIHDNTLTTSSSAPAAVFVPPATIDGRPSTVAERKAAQAVAFPTQALGAS